jgi:2'-5' RNA ligase
MTDHPHLLDEDELDPREEWLAAPTVFIVVQARGPLGERLREIQRRYDPKLAARTPPHLTMTGSSGVGPIPGDITAETLRSALTPIASSTAPFEVSLGRAERFMQTNTVVLPIAPHGAVRALHDRLARSGLPFGPAKFTFTPHVTLSYYATLTGDQIRQLLKEQVREPLIIDHIQCSLLAEPAPPVVLCELPLTA